MEVQQEMVVKRGQGRELSQGGRERSLFVKKPVGK
jgi:hypothetical protein